MGARPHVHRSSGKRCAICNDDKAGLIAKLMLLYDLVVTSTARAMGNMSGRDREDTASKAK